MSRSASIKAAIFNVDDVDQTVWQDFVTVRKAKKMALTVTALDGIRAEATKAGMTLEAALRQCCLMGWAGFKAEWMVAKGNSQTSGLSGETAYQRGKRLLYEAATGRHTTGPTAPPFDTRNVIDITPTTSQGALQ